MPCSQTCFASCIRLLLRLKVSTFEFHRFSLDLIISKRELSTEANLRICNHCLEIIQTVSMLLHGCGSALFRSDAAPVRRRISHKSTRAWTVPLPRIQLTNVKSLVQYGGLVNKRRSCLMEQAYGGRAFYPLSRVGDDFPKAVFLSNPVSVLSSSVDLQSNVVTVGRVQGVIQKFGCG